MRVVFLDYDGVVNNIIWDKEGKRADYGSASSKTVNDFQAVQWVSEFCQKFGYDIVVSSTWRVWEWYKEALWNGGLRDGINIVGRTPVLYKHSRGDEIAQYIKEHPEIEEYIIIDDENDFKNYPEMLERFVQCTTNQGFNYEEFHKAKEIHEKFNGK